MLLFYNWTVLLSCTAESAVIQQGCLNGSYCWLCDSLSFVCLFLAMRSMHCGPRWADCRRPSRVACGRPPHPCPWGRPRALGKTTRTSRRPRPVPGLWLCAAECRRNNLLLWFIQFPPARHLDLRSNRGPPAEGDLPGPSPQRSHQSGGEQLPLTDRHNSHLTAVSQHNYWQPHVLVSKESGWLRLATQVNWCRERITDSPACVLMVLSAPSSTIQPRHVVSRCTQTSAVASDNSLHTSSAQTLTG